MPKANSVVDLHPMALWGGAKDYHHAADLLFHVRQNRPEIYKQRPCSSDPINFLYFHAVELALKAFLRSHNQPIRKTHKLTNLYEQCRSLGLRIGPRDLAEIGNIVTFFEEGNKEQGFRYFPTSNKAEPELSWTREVVEQLMQTIDPGIEARSKQHAFGGQGIMILTIGKPVPKTPQEIAKAGQEKPSI